MSMTIPLRLFAARMLPLPAAARPAAYCRVVPLPVTVAAPARRPTAAHACSCPDPPTSSPASPDGAQPVLQPTTRRRPASQAPPHVYAIAETAYLKLSKTGGSQSIVVYPSRRSTPRPQAVAHPSSLLTAPLHHASRGSPSRDVWRPHGCAGRASRGRARRRPTATSCTTSRGAPNQEGGEHPARSKPSRSQTTHSPTTALICGGSGSRSASPADTRARLLHTQPTNSHAATQPQGHTVTQSRPPPPPTLARALL